jgi:hypothetical protein
MIIERPTINGSLANLSNFKTLQVTDSDANYLTMDTYPASTSGDQERHGVHMYNNGTQLASPTTVSSGGVFSVTQDSCN